ncbi:MAG: hypothetical protein JNL97_00375 [Verrucomicrobiales bacterium]|nr:hypothetical protein [Verrucomicrobiales bacterium]
MRQRVWTGTRMALEVTAFLAGLALIGWAWTRGEPQAWHLALGAVLVVASACSLFVAWRILHLVLIWGFPVAVFLAVGNVVSAWLKARKCRKRSRSEPPPAVGTPPPVSPIVATLIAAAWFGLGSPESTAAVASTAVAAGLPDPSITLISGSYTGAVTAGVARFDATFRLETYSTNRFLRLFGGNVAVESFRPSTNGARLRQDGAWLGVEVAEPGALTFEMTLLVALEGDVTRRQLAFAVPPALASRIDLVVDEPDAEIEFPGAVSFQRTAVGATTRVQGLLGSGDQVLLAWSPRIKRAAEVAATVFVQQASLVTVGSGVAHVRSTLQFQIAQGEMRQARVLLPAGHRLLRVQGPGLRTWDFATNNPLELSIDLSRAATGTLALVIETEKDLGTLPASLALEVPQALDVRRESGVVALRAGDDVLLTLEPSAGLQRVDATEFERLTQDPRKDFVGIYRFLRSDFKLGARAEPIEPEIEATVRQAFTVGTERSTLSAAVDFEVRRLGTFGLALLLPSGWRLENVTCPAMERWTDRRAGDDVILDIALKERTLGKIPVGITLVRPVPALPPRVDLPGVHPLGVGKITGTLEASGEPGVGLKTGSTQGLVEIPVGALVEATRSPVSPPPALAFKYMTATPGPRPAWQLAMDTEQVESWIRAEVAHVVTLSETLVSGRTLVRYEVQNAPARTFSVRVPAAWRNVEILGEGIRRRDVTNGAWTVELQNKVRGNYTLAVHWEQPRESTPTPWQLTGFSVEKVERETGYVTLLARAPLQVSPGVTSGDLARIDIQELPEWTGVTSGTRLGQGLNRTESAVLAWRYLRPGYSLAVEVQRYSDASVLQALVEQARLTTVVADDGQSMTQMRLTVRNNGRQLLEVQLPSGSAVWSATVAGQPVRPRHHQGRLFLPLDGTGDPETPIAIELTYVGTHRFPSARGRVELDSPRLDIPLKDARWDLYLPPDYDYTAFAGSMNHELTDLAPLAQDFTLAEYRRQEEANEEAEIAELKQVVERARTQLSRGLLGRVENELGNIRNRKLKAAEASPEVRQLREELSRMQSSNFLQAQNEFVFSNSGLQAGPTNVDSSAARNYTAEAAGRQAAVVQKAQAITVSLVQPLRVNLPTRGIRHSFTQVLQTEGRRPLTVRFEASNNRRTGWLKPVALGGLAFVALWAAAGFALLFRTPTPSAATPPNPYP